MGWVGGPMLAFDTETTGVSVENDRILSASLVNIAPADRSLLSDTVYINPGVPIPAGATAVHGITDEWIATNGGEPYESLEAVVLVLAAVLSDRQTPIVGHNLVYDFTILDRECRRHGVPTLSDRVGEIWPAIDTFILDKKVDRFRKGTGMRRLENILPIYNIPQVGKAHTSEADCYSAAAVAWRIGRLYPALGALSLAELHALQAQWKAEQDKSMASWLKGQKRDFSDCTGEWPVRLPPVPVEGVLEDAPLW